MRHTISTCPQSTCGPPGNVCRHSREGPVAHTCFPCNLLQGRGCDSPTYTPLAAQSARAVHTGRKHLLRAGLGLLLPPSMLCCLAEDEGPSLLVQQSFATLGSHWYHLESSTTLLLPPSPDPLRSPHTPEGGLTGHRGSQIPCEMRPVQPELRTRCGQMETPSLLLQNWPPGGARN